ncbi:outer membrane protein [Devosia sp.]|uniref:outer membrane protein n=1 Tax=Devosia sp. TaxID=1871048 RepID=UPI001B25649B|nr:outer membrane protein [Devosia sp.]MBO9589991.1 porin family protein [Devosia sp.]
MCLFSCLALLSAPAAMAADVYGDFSLRAPTSAHDWSGAYIGGHLGYGYGQSANQWRSTPVDPWQPDGDIQYQSLLAGLHAGYQHQFNAFVIGAEADLSLGQFRGDDSQFAGLVNTIDISGFGTLRGRIGLAHDNLLVYATAGLAAADFSKGDSSNNFTSRHLASGWAAGAGLEWALADNLSLRAEYLHIHLGAVETGVIGAMGGGYLHRADSPYLNIVRTGLNYRF